MIEYLDSFDHYDNTYLTARGWSSNTANGNGINAGQGRFGTASIRQGGARQASRGLPGGNKVERIFGFAFKANDAFDSRKLFTLLDTGSIQVELRRHATGVLQAYRSGAVVITGAVGTTVLNVGSWYYIELRVLHDNSAGEIELRVDGNVEFNLTGVDTQSTANAWCNGILLADEAGSGGGMDLDDLVVLDMTDSGIAGAPNNDFLGDVRVECLFPTGNGTTSQMDGSDGNSTDNYLLVDETVPDGDTTYVESPDVGDKDTYAYGNLSSANGTVYGLQFIPYARKTDAGLRQLATVARESGGTEEDSAGLTLGASYGYLFDPRDGDPDGNQWTVASINAAEFGVKVAA